ncbi:transmembrane efflux protein [Vibrio orientalis CIP 102891 = ATCC 33934]|uniref:Transmembrane efflux protein n=1 Tax=Vibrio orientalis CIP 102891 = ATCC 33934 TaxID=675816 RepID=F9SXK4_VIBOR|nr:MFS transporter [Vibrio orientalis]EGU46559.1 transmembrane efflux protein [Vibrio orientalis CIP 102891 = ATCC 33934]
MNNVRFTAKEIKILICVCLAQFVSSADNVTTALLIKDIMSFFNVNLSLGQVVTSSYSVVSASLMLVSGLMGYFFSWRSLFRTGLFLCFMGEVSALIFEDFWSFILFSRGLMGTGAALILPSSIALLTKEIQSHNRSMAFSIWGTSVALVVSIYPIILTTIYHLAGWKAGFALLSIIAIIVALLSSWLPYCSPIVSEKRFDYIEAVMSIVVIASILTAIAAAPSFGFFTNKVVQSKESSVVYTFSLPLPALLMITSLSLCLIYLLFKNKTKKKIIFIQFFLERFLSEMF